MATCRLVSLASHDGNSFLLGLVFSAAISPVPFAFRAIAGRSLSARMTLGMGGNHSLHVASAAVLEPPGADCGDWGEAGFSDQLEVTPWRVRTAAR
jgi:hypothetical protein